jgi:CHAT domain-containing protein
VPAGPEFDLATAAGLYTELIQPAVPLLDGVSRVLVVADGPMSVLPLALLPANSPTGPEALLQADWLVRHYGFATLPAVSSLAALRSRPAVRAAGGFIGFGDPVFQGQGAVLTLSRYYEGDRAQAEALRDLPSLPGTRRELLGLAAELGPDQSQLHLGAEATEAVVKATDFTGAGIIAFATHGLIAGDISGLSEPALALTPPASPGAEDDGLLTASEAALLNLRADWVILSACNTAAGDGTPGAEGLSGLASAFLYAGARGLLVSHWPVSDRAAAALTEGAVRRLAAEPAIGQAEALRQSMLEVMAEPRLAHPSFWAPFVAVGDGS